MIKFINKLLRKRSKESSKDSITYFFKHASNRQKKNVFMRVLKEVNEEQKAIVERYGR